MDGAGRTARLVLVADGAVPGVLPPLQLALPWWPEAHDVVAAARARFGIEVVVLRLVATASDHECDIARMPRRAVVEEGRADAW